MRTALKPLLTLSVFVLPIFAGALVVEVGKPAKNPEAQAKHAVFVARITACHSPEKTDLTATAEGIAGGVRQSVPLKVIPLSPPGTFAVTQQWPAQGTWAVKVVARNPEYKNYATGVLVPFFANAVQWDSVKHYSHEPTGEELNAVLSGHPQEDRASLK